MMQDPELERFMERPIDVEGILARNTPKKIQNQIRLMVRALLEDEEGKERVRTVVDLSEKGVTFDDECIGFHGTSIENVMDLLTTGTLRGRTHLNVPAAQALGDLHLYVRRNIWKKQPRKHSFYPDAKIVSEAAIYAEISGSEHLLQTMLGFSKPETAAELLDYLREEFTPRGYEEFDETLRAQGRTKSEFLPLRERALRRKGVVLGISTGITKTHRLVQGDDWQEGDYALRGDPVTLAKICSIEGCGDEEKGILKVIKQEWSKRK